MEIKNIGMTKKISIRIETDKQGVEKEITEEITTYTYILEGKLCPVKIRTEDDLGWNIGDEVEFKVTGKQEKLEEGSI